MRKQYIYSDFNGKITELYRIITPDGDIEYTYGSLTVYGVPIDSHKADIAHNRHPHNPINVFEVLEKLV